MNNHMEIVPFFFKWEGGLSNDKSDSASAKPCPTPFKGKSGYHTNKGVTYAAWVGMFGWNEDARFLTMSDEDWGRIFKQKYWDAVKGDQVPYQSIANVMVSWAWGSGAVTAIRQMQRLLGVTIDGKLGNQTFGAIASYNESELFEKCVKHRENFFRYICTTNPKNLKFLKGWLNRLTEFNKTFHP